MLKRRRPWPSPSPHPRAARQHFSTWSTPYRPPSVRAKLALLERALLQTKATKRLFDRVHIMCEVADRWFELGEHDKGKSLLFECRTLGEQMSGVVDPVRSYFAIRLAHADLPAALEHVRKIRSKEPATKRDQYRRERCRIQSGRVRTGPGDDR